MRDDRSGFDPHGSEAGASEIRGGGAMGDAVRRLDWSQRQIGPIAQWPTGLKVAVNIVLNSRFPLTVYAGPDLELIYNEAYIPVLGGKSPVLGMPARIVWSEIWETFGTVLQQVRDTACASWAENQFFSLHRKGFPEETYFTFSASPIIVEDGSVHSVFVALRETTDVVVEERRRRTLRRLAERSVEAKTVDEACRSAIEVLSENRIDIPFAMLYRREPGEEVARLAATLVNDRTLAPETISLGARFDDPPWPVRQALECRMPVEVDLRPPRFSAVRRPWDVPCERAQVLPLLSSADEDHAAVLILGINPRREWVLGHRQFFQDVADRIKLGIGHARAFELEARRAERLSELDRAKVHFLGDVSNELRTPLTLLIEPLEQALSQSVALERPALERVHQSALRLRGLINSLLDYSRLEAGRLVAKFEMVEVSELTAELANVFRATMGTAKPAFVIDCPKSSQPLLVDREMWEKIVLNLLANAFKFTDVGCVCVSLQSNATEMILTVADTGMGIAPEAVAHLFERNRPGFGATQQRREDIGLALVHGLAKLHGGRVEVESEVGVGSKFRVIIPRSLERPGVVAPPTAVRLPVTTARQLQRPGKARLLVAESHGDMRAYLETVLSPHWLVDTVPDSRAALDEIRRDPPDLILVDPAPPEVDGDELIRCVREDGRTRRIPIIFLTARRSDSAEGADDCVTKPFSERELIARVEAALKIDAVRRESLREIEETIDQVRLAFRAGSVGIWRYDVRTDLASWNQSVGRPFDFAAGMFEGTYENVLRQVHEADRERVATTFMAALESGKPFACVFRIYDATERVRWVDGRGVICRDSDGRPVNVVGAVIDVTVQKEAEEALRSAAESMARSNAELERYAHVASHDLQEPLQRITVFLERLEKEYRDRPLDRRAARLLDGAVVGASRMRGLIDDLLDYSKTDTAGHDFVSVRCDEVFDRVRENLKRAIEDAGAELDRGLLPTVYGNEGQLVRLFQNLIENAIKFRSERPLRIHVGSETRGDDFVFCVRDNGRGFDPMRAMRIFDMFHPLPNGRRGAGSGIGLASCKRIIEMHRGRIWADSTLGEGATFFFTLPRPALH